MNQSAIDKVVLVAPPGRCLADGTFHAVPPEGLARLAAWLRKLGPEVYLVDALMEGYDQREQDCGTVRYGLSPGQIARRVASFDPDLVGLGCTFTCIEPDVLQIARETKALLPATPVVLGGTHAAVNAAGILEKEPAVDIVALGEGELAVSSMMNARPAGLARRTNQDIRLVPADRFAELDDLPLPAWDLFDLRSYAEANAPHGGTSAKRRFLPTSWSRGCVNACSFCLTPRVWGAGNYRHRSVEHILSEAEQLCSKYQIEELHLEDDCLTANKQWFISALESLAGQMPDLRLEMPNGLDANCIEPDLAAALGRVRAVRLGISFGVGPHDGSLRLVGKPLESGQGHQAVRLVHDQGINVIGYFQIGFPGQSIDDMKTTVEYALSLGIDDAVFFIATPFPGTPLYELCKRNDWLVESLDFREFRLSKGLIRTAQFGPEDTERIRREGWEEFHRRKKGAG